MVDERPRHAHALLLAARELRRQMVRALGEAHALERGARFWRVGHRVVVLRDHHVLECGEMRKEMKLLEDDADLLAAEAHALVLGHRRQLLAVDPEAASRGFVEGAEQIDQRALARAGGPHHREPFAGVDAQVHLIERLERAVMARDTFEPDQRFARHHSPFSTGAGSTARASRIGPSPATTATAMPRASTSSGTSQRNATAE
jgi:hypothetical protein